MATKLILTQDVSGLGSSGDVVEVKGGYARNYLLPRGFAMSWTKGAEKQIASITRARQVREVRDLGHAQEIATSLEKLPVRLSAKAGQGGRLFGSITVADVAAAIKSSGGGDVDRRRIDIPTPIKSLGSHAVHVRLHPEVAATVSIEVVSV